MNQQKQPNVINLAIIFLCAIISVFAINTVLTKVANHIADTYRKTATVTIISHDIVAHKQYSFFVAGKTSDGKVMGFVTDRYERYIGLENGKTYSVKYNSNYINPLIRNFKEMKNERDN